MAARSFSDTANANRRFPNVLTSLLLNHRRLSQVHCCYKAVTETVVMDIGWKSSEPPTWITGLPPELAFALLTHLPVHDLLSMRLVDKHTKALADTHMRESRRVRGCRPHMISREAHVNAYLAKRQFLTTVMGLDGRVCASDKCESQANALNF